MALYEPVVTDLNASIPRPVFLCPVDAFAYPRARYPAPVFPLPSTFNPESLPIQVLLPLVVTALNAYRPTAVLLFAVVFASNALKPTAVLSAPVVLAVNAR